MTSPDTGPHSTADPREHREPPPRFVERLLSRAAADGVSDIYLIPEEKGIAVRRRIRGVPETVTRLEPAYAAECVNRLKVLAAMLTYRNSIAQDGVIRGVAGAPDTEFRLAVLPTIHGERVTIRLLAAGRTLTGLEALGFVPDVAAALRDMVSRTGGMVIFTGPTGSGKTTTIYACVRHLLEREEDPASILSIEDPVENDFGVISQVSLTRGTEEWNYGAALRAALRQDVKTLVVGEMRDREVVRMTLEAALTGHRVLTTFHAGDVAAVYARLLHLDFEPYLVAGTIAGVVNQRLVNRLCPACRRPEPAHSDFCRQAGITSAWTAPGCDACNGRGTVGRMPVASLVRADDDWRELVASKPPLGHLRKAAAERPFGTLDQALRQAVAAGEIDEKDALRLRE